MEELNKKLALRLKEIRKKKGLSMEALASLSGVSRSMVSQIERGTSSPTVSTLWNLSKALGIGFSEMVGEEETSKKKISFIQRAHNIPKIENSTGCMVCILSPPENAGREELYQLDFIANGTLSSDSHWPGCNEQLVVLSGELTVEVAGEKALLKTGDIIRYAADEPHSIVAGNQPASAILIVSTNISS